MKRTIYITVVGLILILIFNYAYAEERITLSTYYPAPYGEYRKLAIGSSAGGYTAPTSAEIDLVVEGNVGIGTTEPSSKLEVAGWYGRTAHNNGGLVGSYNNVGANSYKTSPIYVIGSNYKPLDASLSNMYGIGYTHTNTSFITDPGPDSWGMYVAADGDARIFLAATALGSSYFNAGNVGIGTTSPGEKLTVAGTIESTTGGVKFPDGTIQTTKADLPSGVIVMWSGLLTDIGVGDLTGWALCNGASGTPDLTDRFIYGLTTGAPGAGGSATHSHGVGRMEVRFGPDTGDTNIVGQLSFSGGQTLYGGYGMARRWIDNSGIIFSGPGSGVPYLQTQSDAVTDTASTAPRYYKLAFIMKL